MTLGFLQTTSLFIPISSRVLMADISTDTIAGSSAAMTTSHVYKQLCNFRIFFFDQVVLNIAYTLVTHDDGAVEVCDVWSCTEQNIYNLICLIRNQCAFKASSHVIDDVSFSTREKTKKYCL